MSEVAESPAAIIASRLVTPVLLVVVSVLLTVLISTVSAAKDAQIKQGDNISALQRQFGELNTKVDYALVQRVSALEDRVRTLEQHPR